MLCGSCGHCRWLVPGLTIAVPNADDPQKNGTPSGGCCIGPTLGGVDIMGDVGSTPSSAGAGSMGGPPDEGGRMLIALMAGGVRLGRNIKWGGAFT